MPDNAETMTWTSCDGMLRTEVRPSDYGPGLWGVVVREPGVAPMEHVLRSRIGARRKAREMVRHYDRCKFWPLRN